MPLFCAICRNLLISVTTPDEFKFQCEKCQKFEKPGDTDLMVYEDVSGTNLVIYKSILHNAGKDPVNPKVTRKCKCGSKFAKQVRLGSEMKLINTCVSCGNQWLDGTTDEDAQEESGETSGSAEVKKIKIGKSKKSKE